MAEQVDSKWYHEVIVVCAFTHDFDSFLDGDETKIGSRGLNLSGGQRQRVVSHSIALCAVDVNHYRHLHELYLQDAI